MLGFSSIAEAPMSSLASDFEIEVILTDAGVLIWTLNTFSNQWTSYTRENTWTVAPVLSSVKKVYSSNEWIVSGDNNGEWNI